MMGFIFRFLKGLILGWIMSLVFYLVKRMLAKTLGADMLNPQKGRTARPQPGSQQRSSHSTQSANQNALDVVETIWVGMTAQQLLTAFGAPLSKEAIAGGEVWTYANLAGQSTQTAITIQNNAVSSWQEIKRPPTPDYPTRSFELN